MPETIPVGDVPAVPATITWIREPEALDQWLVDGGDGPLALDTEFERVNTFYPIPGLVQLGRGERFCLVDPPVAEASAGFRALLTNPDVPKLLYAMSEDLELFRHWLGLDPAGLVDLQIGAALAGAGFSVGYAKLVEALFGEALDKSVTRSDWVSRPLTPVQERYAIDDVRFLVALHQWVAAKLSERNLTQALAEESERFATDLGQQDDPENHYLKLRGGWGLRADSQRILKSITWWRENECRERDRPRNRILPDAALLAIAEKRPRNLQTLGQVPGVPPVVVRRYGDQLLELISEALESDVQPEVIARPLTKEQQGTYRKVKKVLTGIAEAADVPVELLAPRRRLEAVVQEGTIRTGWFAQGWRQALVEPVQNQIEELLNV